MDTAPLQGAKIVVTGVTGQVAEPLACALARHNEVYGAARFNDPEARRRLEAAGIRCVAVDLSAGEPAELPCRCRLRAELRRDQDQQLGCRPRGQQRRTGVADGTPSRTARAFLHCSTAAVYRPKGHHVFAETDPLGDNHGVWPYLRTYSICKIAAEATARWAARRFELPTTIARLSVPYGDRGGWPAVHLHMMIEGSAIPVHVDAPSVYHPLHERDVARMLPAFLDAASVPATIVNWAGDAAVSIEEWCTYLAEITGLAARFEPTERTIDSGLLDLTRMHEIAGPTAVDWKDGMRQMVAARHGELLSG